LLEDCVGRNNGSIPAGGFVSELYGSAHLPTLAAIQLQSSLLSISVSAVLLPAGAIASFWPSARSLIGALAYHVVLCADTEDDDPESTHLTPTVDITSQRESISKMSHGVAVILLSGKTQCASPN